MTTARPDPDALYAHATFVRGVARAALGGDPEVEDVVQETWAAALRSGPDRPGALRAWLGGVTRRQAAQARRRRVREQRRRAEAERRASGRSPAEASVSEVLARAEIGRLLIDAVLALPDHYRAVLLLRYYDDLQPREIAGRLDLPVETVRTRTRRGVALLRERLDEQGLGRDENWRAGLVLLLAAPPTGVSAALGTVLGALLMKKIVALAALALLLLGGGALWLRPWEEVTRPEEGPSASVVIAREGAGAGASLVGRTDPGDAAPASDRLPPPVDLAAIDRDRDLHGVVTARETGEPLRGTSIALFERPWSRTGALDGRCDERVEVAATRTASDGSWRIRLEAGGRAELEVRAPGRAAVRVEGVQAGERVDLALERGVTLAVTTVDPAGRHLEGTQVRVWAAAGGMPTVRGTTDAEGRYLADGLRPGTAVMVAASHPVHGAAMWRQERTPATGTGTAEIRIPLGRVLEGRITDTTTGAPIAGARIGIGWAMDDPVLSDTEGYYELPGWTAQGVYEIAVHAAGYAQDEAVVGDRARIDFALAPEDAIRGRVVDGSGRPVPGVRIAAVGSSFETGRQVVSSGSTITGEEGTFRIGELRHDLPHTLVLVARGYGRTLYDVHPPLIAGETVDAGDLPLHGAGAVLGVVAAADGTPIARVPVELRGANADRARFADGRRMPDHGYGSEEERFTDDLGRYRFRDLAPGTYHLEVRLPRGRQEEREVELEEAGAVARADFRIREGRPFTVRVENEAGEGVDQARVVLRLDGGVFMGGESNADGCAAFEVEQDPISLEILTLSELTGVRYLDPPQQEIPAGATEVRILLVEAELIRGRVIDRAGAPLAAVTLRAVRDGVTVSDSWTRKNGTFQLEVPAGAVVDVELEGSRLEESGSGWIAREAFITGGVKAVKAGTEDVVVHAGTIASDASITVVVTDPKGRPLADARVFVNGRGNKNVAMGRTGADGRVTLDGLPRTELNFLAARAPRARDESWVLPAFTHATPAGQTLTLAYRLGDTIRGVVVDSEGVPIPNGVVAAKYGEEEYHARTDEHGHFEARVAADAGGVTLRARRADPATAPSEPIVVRPGAGNVRIVMP